LQRGIILGLHLALELDVLILGAADVVKMLDEHRKPEGSIGSEVGQAALRGLQQTDLLKGSLAIRCCGKA